MNFGDEILDGIDLSDFTSIARMITEYLCGERYYGPLLPKEQTLLNELLNKVQTDRINYAQFNELLLLLNQARVSEAFFNFFFGGRTIGLQELKEGIVKFRGFAMLCFGNFRFAYKELIQKNEQELQEHLHPYCQTAGAKDKFKDRPPKALEIEEVKRNKTWYTGFIAKKKYEKEADLIKKELHKATSKRRSQWSLDDLLMLGELYEKIGKDIEQVETIALKNTDVYLTWNYMDVYIATSMRHRWEFEETFSFIQAVFRDKRLQRMKLRYFDPTQSQCENRIDKGLVEGLMLKRATCAVYMAQEAETLGKDSELAATMAQGKPVIAYVPDINITSHAKKISTYPLDYFRLRFPVLQAEGILDDEKCIKELEEYDPQFTETIRDFVTKLNEYYEEQPFKLWTEREDKFKRETTLFERICKLLAIAQRHAYQKRTATLKTVHPLSIQVDLKSGVANGLLVVRSPKECANLLLKTLTHTMDFIIKHVGEENRGVTILEEEISGCPFRVVTDYEKLTNSFWNFYLHPEQ